MSRDPLILAFDTSVAHCAAALLSGEAILAERRDEMARGQGEHLMAMLGEMLHGQGLEWADVGVLAVGIGPGNFTGIRISVAAARGLALGLGVPAMGVSTFEIMRAAASGDEAALVGLRAPRGAHYVQEFAGARPVGPPRYIGPGESPEPGASVPVVLGHDAALLAGYWGAAQWREVELPAFGPAIAGIALTRWRGGETAPAHPAPLYVRAADAAPARDAPPVLLD